MSNMNHVNESKPLFEKAIEHLQTELGGIRTGRATPALVENIQVEVYGAFQPVKAVASISTQDAKTLVIQPWDQSMVKPIENAIAKSDVGIMPTVDGKSIRLSMPMMTDETRQRLIKVMKEKMEEARIACRQVRDEVKKKIDKEEGVGDDDKHRELENLDKLTKETNARIDEVGSKKETEITTI
jgi:ribosome recycling factor